MIKNVLIAALLTTLASCAPEAEPFLPEYVDIDLVIEHGMVLDGLGNEAIQADIVVVDDEIVFVGESLFSRSDFDKRITRRIDATGKTVSPGFIDLHSHGDPIETPAFENFLAMGVTTITLGQDGSSPEVASLTDWLNQVSAQGIGANLAMFVGHGTLRNLSGIGRSEVPEPENMAQMQRMLDAALEYTFGMSTGLEYNPGLNARSEELRALAKTIGAKDRMIMSHMRNEDDGQLEASIAELLEQGDDARVHVSHLKSVYGKGVARAEEILAILSAARSAGVRVTAEIYPYSASYTDIGILFPVWAKTAEQFEQAKTERREELADYLRNRVMLRNGPEATLLGTDPWTGRTLAEIAHEMELPFEDVLIDVIGPQGAYGAYFVMNDELQARLLQNAYVGVCSDGSPGGFHPRGHGTFARIIESYVVNKQVLTLQEAVRKMTSFAASVLGITDRGVIAPGMKADIIIFDPTAVHERASYPDPFQLADGFDTVIVNGAIARDQGRLGESLHGVVLQP